MEKDLIDHNVRFDMTVHTIGIIRLIEAARRFLGEHRELFAHLSEPAWLDDFLTKKPKPTARWSEFAVFILAPACRGCNAAALVR